MKRCKSTALKNALAVGSARRRTAASRASSLRRAFGWLFLRSLILLRVFWITHWTASLELILILVNFALAAL